MRGVWTREEGGKKPGQLGGPDGCGCVLIHRAGPFGRAGWEGEGAKKIRGQWVGRGRALEQMPGEQWGF